MLRNIWTRDELVVAYGLYCRIPFGRIHTRNPEIISLAKALGRTPSAVSWKLANFARLDPSLKNRNVTGASHGAKLELLVWKEFNQDWDKLAFESSILLARFEGKQELDDEIALPDGKMRATQVMVRVNQSFFRTAILAAYDGRCCITGLSISELLNASHIVPWRIDEKNRTNPCNGLCLNAIHDRAFDAGLLTVTPQFKVRIAPHLMSSKDSAVADLFARYQDREINLPSRFRPSSKFLEYHNREIFCSQYSQ